MAAGKPVWNGMEWNVTWNMTDFGNCFSFNRAEAIMLPRSSAPAIRYGARPAGLPSGQSQPVQLAAGGYEGNQTRVSGAAGRAQGERATIQLLPGAPRRPISPQVPQKPERQPGGAGVGVVGG